MQKAGENLSFITGPFVPKTHTFNVSLLSKQLSYDVEHVLNSEWCWFRSYDHKIKYGLCNTMQYV